MGPFHGEGASSEWLKRAFSVLELEDVELDMEQLDTLGKVGTGVQGAQEQHAIILSNVLLLLIWRCWRGTGSAEALPEQVILALNPCSEPPSLKGHLM